MQTAKRKRDQPISAWIPARMLRKLKEESRFKSHTLTDEVVESLNHYTAHLLTGITFEFDKKILENYEFLVDSMKRARYLNLDEFLYRSFLKGYEATYEKKTQ
ncbi:MAG: hypothetical protein ACFFD4_21330 [Candidatus Odinarchaeota archaeon]